MVAQCWIDGYVSHFSFKDCIGHIFFILNVSSTQLIIVLRRSCQGSSIASLEDYTHIVAHNISCKNGKADVANVKELRHGLEGRQCQVRR